MRGRPDFSHFTSRETLRARCSPDSRHSQTTAILQPMSSRLASVRMSRMIVASNFERQKAAFEAGVVANLQLS